MPTPWHSSFSLASQAYPCLTMPALLSICCTLSPLTATCIPHSVRFWPLKRPSRSFLAFGSVFSVVTTSPMEPYPWSWSELYGTLCRLMYPHTSSLPQFASGLILTLPSLGSTSRSRSVALSPPWLFLLPVTHTRVCISSSALFIGSTLVRKSKRWGSARHRCAPIKTSNSSRVLAPSGLNTLRWSSPKCFLTARTSSYVSGKRCSVSTVAICALSRRFILDMRSSATSPEGPKDVTWHQRPSGISSAAHFSKAPGCSSAGSFANLAFSSSTIASPSGFPSSCASLATGRPWSNFLSPPPRSCAIQDATRPVLGPSWPVT
mmetsp:Transcript_47858/g.119629  ORF Transcript_47858/g.119629 Transcript_47858/m.119629 type:complete len:320 (-) Transcript_47858:350-1309(-)